MRPFFRSFGAEHFSKRTAAKMITKAQHQWILPGYCGLGDQLDIVLGFKSTSHEAPNVLFRPLRTDGLNCIVKKDSPLAALNEVGLDDVVGYPQVVCLPASIRRKGSTAQGSIPRTDDEHTITCSTTTEAFALVDAGFGYALIPAIETMPDPNQKALAWKSGAKATFGAYVRDDAREDLVSHFLEVAEEEYAQIKPQSR